MSANIPTITLTPALFRQAMPEFNNVNAYTDPVINFWITIAGNVFNACRWGAMLNYGAQLFVAHHLVLGKRNQDAVAAGGNPGELKGPVSSRSVDRVSNSYDTNAVRLDNQGFWALTTYGLELFQYQRYMGAGGMQLMCGPPGPGDAAWPGIV